MELTTEPTFEQPETVWRRHWRVADPAHVGDRLAYAALSAFRVAISRDRYYIRDHTWRRMAERGVSLHELLHCVEHGRICRVAAAVGWVGGGYLEDELLVIVGTRSAQGTDFFDLIPTICTVYRSDALEPAEPLTVALREFVHSEIASLMGCATMNNTQPYIPFAAPNPRRKPHFPATAME